MALPAKKDDYQDQKALAFYLNPDNSPEAVCAYLVEGQHERTGQVGEPDDVTREILDLAQAEEEDGEDWYALFADNATEFHAEAARLTPGIKGVNGDEWWNNAILTGDECPEWNDLMETVVHVSRGYQYTDPAKKKFNTRDDQWNGASTTWGDLIEGHPGKAAFSRKDRIPAHGFSRHPEVDTKSGAGTNFANCNTYRRAKSVTSVAAAVIDADSGHFTFEEAVERAQATRRAFIAHTTHSHLSTETALVYDDVVRHAKTHEEPTLDQIKDYVRTKKNVAPHIADSIEVEEMRAETPDGWMIRLRHDPIPKFRIIFPLAEGDVALRDLANTQADALKVFASKVRGVAQLVGIPTDPATTDASRLFYDPRHAKGKEHRTIIHRAPPISFADIPEVDATGNETGDPFAAGTKSDASTKRRPDVVTEDGTDVSALYDMYAKRWMLADICETAGLETSAQVSNSGGKFHVHCPFADGHTDPDDDGATFAMNAEDSQTEFAVIKCMHGSCAGRHTVEYLAAWIDSGELDAADLEDPEFMAPFADGQEEEKFVQRTPEETLGEAEAHAHLRERLEKRDGKQIIPDAAVESCTAMLIEMGRSNADADEIVAEAVLDVERQLTARTADREHDPVAAARREVQGREPVPHVLDDVFDERLVDDDGFILNPDHAPKLYREFGIDPKDDKAYKKMQLEIRDQIYRSMVARFSYVVLDGEAKVAIRQPQGEGIKLWREATTGKLYVNRAAKFWDKDSKGKSLVKEIKPAEVFLHARRRPTYFDTCFEPDPIKADAAAHRGAYNLWNGFAVDPKPGDWSMLRNHIKNILCDGDEDLFNFVMTWLASPFARPGVKVPSSLAIIGEQGTGKSKVFDWIRKAIGAAALKVSAMRHLTGNFNAHLDGLILLVCEEAFWGGNKAEGGVLKDLISSETLQIEGKFKDLVERNNYVNMVFISNNKWTVPVDGEDARRFCVLAASNAVKKDAAYFGAIDDQMENGGLAAMVHELMNWDPACIGGWEALRYPPVTDSLRQQAGMGLHGPAERLVSSLESGVLSGRTPDGDVFHYNLSDTEPTNVTRNHMVAAICTNDGRGNLTQEMKDAITKFLGEDADHGENKKVIEYLGHWDRSKDQREERETSGRERYVTIPALNDLKDILARYGRG